MNLAALRTLAPHLSAWPIGALYQQSVGGVGNAIRRKRTLEAEHPRITFALHEVSALRLCFPTPQDPVPDEPDYATLLDRSIKVVEVLSRIPAEELGPAKQLFYSGIVLLGCKPAAINETVVQKVGQRIVPWTIGKLFAESRNGLQHMPDGGKLPATHSALPGLLEEVIALRGYFPKDNEPALELDFTALFSSCASAVDGLSKVRANGLNKVQARLLDHAKQYLYGGVMLVASKATPPTVAAKSSPPAKAAVLAPDPSTKSWPTGGEAKTAGPSDSDVHIINGPGLATSDTGPLDDAIASGTSHSELAADEDLFKLALDEEADSQPAKKKP